MAACCLLSFSPVFFFPSSSATTMRGNFDDLWMNQHEFGERAYLIQASALMVGTVSGGGQCWDGYHVTQPLPSSIQTFATFAVYGEVSCVQLERDEPCCEARGGFRACTCLIACRHHPTPSSQNALMATRLSVCIHSRRPEFGAQSIFFPACISVALWKFAPFPTSQRQEAESKMRG